MSWSGAPKPFAKTYSAAFLPSGSVPFPELSGVTSAQESSASGSAMSTWPCFQANWRRSRRFGAGSMRSAYGLLRLST